MSLIKEIKEASDQAFDTWFERWFEKKDFVKQFKRSARKGYSSLRCDLPNYNLTEEDKYINRRLRDPRTVKKLKERLPGVTVEFIQQEYKNFLGRIQVEEFIIFSWNE
ncbi:hypothetical protein P7H00_11055 [Enterococcus pseudoavium]|uniref:Uncharacterized protein n=1 Tax=Enterococcus pseudoavium TaxID=44007 RepID=A0AAE4I1B5_9ENTE|nr:hypothetical protein [Enterococcus pseudoavium]MDT2737649.1 hypothetical protein [Enterococcus pseudoavium]